MKKIIPVLSLIFVFSSTMIATPKIPSIYTNACEYFHDKEVEFPFPITIDFKKNKNTSLKNVHAQLDKVASYLIANTDVKVALRANYKTTKQQQIAWDRYQAICTYFQEKWNIDKNRFHLFLYDKVHVNQFTIELPTKEEIYKLENPGQYPPPPSFKK